MEQWEEDYVKEKYKEIDELETNKKEILELLENETDKKKIYESSWKLKEIHEKIKMNYKIIGRWSQLDLNKKILINFCREIYYYEKCLKMLFEHRRIKGIDLQNIISLTNLEYEYFIEEKQDFPEEYYQYKMKLLEHNIYPGLYLVLKNLINSIKSVRRSLIYYKKNNQEKELFLFYEVKGDLFIQIYYLLKKNLILKNSIYTSLIQEAYNNYKIAIKYKNAVQNQKPTTYIDGLHGLNYLSLFSEFFKDLDLYLHDVHKKFDYLSKRFELN